MWKPIVLAAMGGALLAGCASVAPIQQDQPLMLAAGDGVAAVQFDALENITQVQIVAAKSGGQTLNIPSVPVGKSTFLFEVPAGRYCLERFYVQGIFIYQKDANSSCFMVPAGQIGFSGIFSPRGEHGQIITYQNLDVAADSALLKQSYPKIAAQFLQMTPAPAAAQAPAPSQTRKSSNGQTTTWIKHETHPLEDTIYLRNDTQWPLVITSFQFYDCANIKPACTTSHPDFKLAPHQTRVYMQVQPADVQGAYTFYYRFSYRIDMTGKQ
ncbi:MAG: hypothetical protein KGL13_08685 [Gammaproteobacteria bacterium]|nr:hypothetical protein [Gammaproteobacteria bacterium]